jgi:hypothetical protein
MNAKVWLPDGKECPESKVIDGKGTLVNYSLDGKEISRRNIRAGRTVIPARKSRTITIPQGNPFLRPGSTRPSNSPKSLPPPPPKILPPPHLLRLLNSQ